MASILSVPNLLSAYRLSAAPVAAWAAIAGHKTLFFTLVCISLASDVLDGLIARAFHQTTTLGARLDSIADEVTLPVAVLGVVIFNYSALEPDIGWLWMFLVCYALSTLVPLMRFKRFPAFHLYLFRVNGYLLAAYFAVLFTHGHVTALFVLAMIFGSLASLEVAFVALALPEFRTDQRGLYWVLRERAAASNRS